MVKNQKRFNPLECGLCKYVDCPQRNYENLYSAGIKLRVSDCKNLQDLKTQKQKTMWGFGYEKNVRRKIRI